MNRRGFLGRLAAIASVSSVATLQPKHSPLSDLVEDELLPVDDVLAKPAYSWYSEIVLAIPNIFRVGDYVYCPKTGETMLVYGVGNSLLVERGIGPTRPSDMEAGESLRVIGSEYREGHG